MRWKILANKKNIHSADKIIDIILKNRGLKLKKNRQDFLETVSLSKITTKEVGIKEKELIKTADLIKKTIKNNEKIIIYGDYDADGVCATAIMWETLECLGAKVMPFIPKREEGYGLNNERLDILAADGIKLIITVDQGIVHNAQVKHAREIGLKIIITDHHIPGEKIPLADAIVHTTSLAGCGVAWFLSRFLIKKFKLEKKCPDNLDLTTIGSVTDMVPLIGPNRILIKNGLLQLMKTKRLGLKELYKLAGLNKEKISTYEIGFIVGPRLNATGRMDDPLDALRLLCTRNRQRAEELAGKIHLNNLERQSLTKEISLKAREKWLKEDGVSPLIFVYDETFHEGVIGLVASKLVEQFYRPTVILSKGEKYSKASARSIDSFNIIEAIRSCSTLLEGHGGHPKAAGFSIETTKLEILRTRLIEIASSQLSPEDLIKQLRIDLELGVIDLSLDLLQKLNALEPFGEGNPEPVFVTRNLFISDAQLLGVSKNHLKLTLESKPEKIKIKAIGFNMGSFYEKISPDKNVDVVYNLIVDDWQGAKKLQLKLKDIRLSDE